MPVPFKLNQNQLDRWTMQTEALTTQLEKQQFFYVEGFIANYSSAEAMKK